MIEPLLTAILTLFIGVVIYVLGQIASKFFIEPVHELSQTIGRIGDSLIFYANVYTNKVDPKKHKEANEILRQQTSMLKARAQMVRWYSLFHRLGFIPSKEDIAAAHFELIGISNLTPRDSSDCVTNLKRSNKVKILLRLIDKAEQSNLLTE